MRAADAWGEDRAMRASRTAVVLSIAVAGTAAVPAVAAAPPRPNLRVAGLAVPSGTVAAGAALAVDVTVRNRGRVRAGSSAVALVLSRDRRRGRGDLALEGGAEIGALRPGARATASVRAVVPRATPAGRWFVVACADGGAVVRETSEHDNCTAARRAVTVTAAPAAPAAPPTPAPAPPAPAPPAPAPAAGAAPAAVPDAPTPANTTTQTTPATTTTETTPTTPTPPPDADGDGIPDAEDACPQVAAPDGFCPATPYAIAQGLVAPGAKVALPRMPVTAVSADGTTAWAQLASSAPDYAGVKGSGVELTLAPGTDVAAGDLVTVEGTVGPAGAPLQVSSLVKVGTAALEPAYTLTASEMTSQLASFVGVLVRAENTTVQSTDAGGWTIDHAVTVAGRIIGTLPATTAGTTYTSITGLVSADGRLLPRSQADIVAAP